jgi:hypothetical protein
LLGETVNPQDHRPYMQIGCFAPCMIHDREETDEEELQVQGLFNQLGHSATAGEEQPGGRGDRAKTEDKSLEGGNGEASGQGQQWARDKGKAKVQDSWCTGWLKKVEASRRKKEEREEKRRKQKSQEERLKKEEEQRLLECLARSLSSSGGREAEGAGTEDTGRRGGGP